MKDQIRILSRLQALEQQRRAISARKGKVGGDEIRRLWQEVRLLAQTVTADREKLVCLEKVCARQEDDLTVLNEQCAQAEAKLYSGEIRNGKELEQLTAKCEKIRRDIGEREEEAFANIEYYEELTMKIALEEAALQEMKRQHADKRQQVTQTLAGIEEELAAVDEQCRLVTGQIQQQYLSLFRELGAKLPQPVAKVDNGICGGCRRNVPIGQLALTQTQMVFCDNCGRILWME